MNTIRFTGSNCPGKVPAIGRIPVKCILLCGMLFFGAFAGTLNTVPDTGNLLRHFTSSLFAKWQSDPFGPDTFTNGSRISRIRRLSLGTGILTAEYVAGPVIAYQAWWSAGIQWGNPFDHIDENEPYMEDDAWHFACCAMVSELNYTALYRGFHLDKTGSVIGASALTFITYTGIEVFDALEKTGKWGFSISDEVANCMGIGFWILKSYFPGLPLTTRVGVRKWNDIYGAVAHDIGLFTRSYEEYYKDKADHYALLKVETICKVYKEAYVGVALSKHESPSVENLWGITAGYDLISLFNKRAKGRWNRPIAFLSDYGSFGIGFTFWHK